jgi:thiol:disulfide interchange protein
MVSVAQGKVTQVSTDAEFQRGMVHPGLVVIDFYADWCVAPATASRSFLISIVAHAARV